MDDLIVKETFENATVFNVSSGLSDSKLHCYYLYEYSRAIYIPLFHALIMITGLVVNLYMLISLHCIRSKESLGSLSDVDFFFSHLGVCAIATLLTIPVWVTQTILVKGWVFGYVVCKLMKGLTAFSFQYGIFIMVYINIERYMKVVHNRTTFKCLMSNRQSKGRRVVSRLCACLPALSALVDICYYTVHPIAENTVMCVNSMHPDYQMGTFWFRMNICFILPIIVLVYCNGMIVYSVRRHMNWMSFQSKMKRSLILPFLTVMFFILCWIPWIISSIYYRRNVNCEEVKYVVLNVCIAIGNMHCITSPTLYIIIRFRRNPTQSTPQLRTGSAREPVQSQ